MATSKPTRFRSSFERRIREQLDALGVKYEYEGRKIRYDAFAERTYTPDIILETGIIVELKGHFTSQDRVKHKFIKEQHPELDIRFVFQRAKNRLNKGSKTTYADWCDKNGFLWAEGSIPAEWYAKPERKNKRKERGVFSAGPERLYNEI